MKNFESKQFLKFSTFHKYFIFNPVKSSNLTARAMSHHGYLNASNILKCSMKAQFIEPSNNMT